MLPLQPIYTAANCRSAYQLNWSLALFGRVPFPRLETWAEPLRQATETDGVRILEQRLKAANVVQLLVSTRPETAPAQALRSVKGRLQYLIRDEIPKAFHRNYRLESVGSARQDVVAQYVAQQRAHHPMADPRVQERFAQYQIRCPEVDLTQLRTTAHGQFLYNLHLVLVHAERWHEVGDGPLTATRDMIRKVCRTRGYRLSQAGIVADHLHLTMGCDVTQAPQEVALCLLNNLAYVQGMRPIYQYGFYVGTFGNYDLGAIRQALAASHPSTGASPVGGE
jgi:REP element-mobilizing transposase RayT